MATARKEILHDRSLLATRCLFLFRFSSLLSLRKRNKAKQAKQTIERASQNGGPVEDITFCVLVQYFISELLPFLRTFLILGLLLSMQKLAAEYAWRWFATGLTCI